MPGFQHGHIIAFHIGDINPFAFGIDGETKGMRTDKRSISYAEFV